MKLARKCLPLSEDCKLILNPQYKIIKIDPNEVYVTHSFRSIYSYTIVDDRRLGVLSKIFDMLRQPTSIQELISELKLSPENTSYIKDLINDIYRIGIICKADENPIIAYYKIHYDELPDLVSKNICIVGCGPLGIRIILTLLSLGFEHINIFDDRLFLNSREEILQYPYYLRKYIISCKTYTDIIKNFIENFKKNEISIYHISNDTDKDLFVDIAKKSDITIVTAEYYRPKLFNEINELAHKNMFTLIYGFIDGSIGVVGPLIIPKETACYMCFENAVEACLQYRENFISYKHQMMLYEEGQTYFISQITPLYDIVSGFVVDNLIRFLIGDISPLLSRVLFLNFESLEMDIQDILKNPRCPVCSQLKPSHKSLIEL